MVQLDNEIVDGRWSIYQDYYYVQSMGMCTVF